MHRRIKSTLVPKLILITLALFALISTTLILLNNSSKPKETKVQAAQEFAKDCKDGQFYENCYQKLFKDFATKNDFETSKSVLKQLQNIDPKLNSCHLMAHIIAAAAVQNTRDWQSLLKNQDPMECSGGYFHGIVEGRARLDGNSKVDANTIINFCKDYPKGQEGSCIHIMGHILLVDKLDNLDNAVKECDLVVSENQYQCYSGVFMEHMTRENLVVHTIVPFQITWDINYANQMTQLCSTFTKNAAMGCWGEIGPLYATAHANDPTQTRSDCRQAKNNEWIENCYIHGAVKIAVTSNDSTNLKTLCEPYFSDSEKHNDCALRVIDAMLSTSENYLGAALKFCYGDDIKYQDYCLKAVSNKTGRPTESFKTS